MLEIATNEIRLLLDENVSPNIAAQLWQQGVNAIPLRDRSMLRVTDREVLAFAQSENRAVTTIDLSDFEKLVAGVATHAGIVAIPSGGSRDEQLNYILAAAARLREFPNPMNAARDHVIAVNENLEVVTRRVVLEATPMLTVIRKPSA